MKTELTTEEIICKSFEKILTRIDIKVNPNDRIFSITSLLGNSIEIRIITLPIFQLLKDVFNDKIVVECYIDNIKAYSLNTTISVVRPFIQRLPSLLIKLNNDSARQKAFEFITL